MPVEFLTGEQAAKYAAYDGAEAELRGWVDARAWTTGEGPKALFDAAVGWLRERRVLLPGVTTLARLVAAVREAANQRLWDTLYGLLSTGQRAVLDSLLSVPPGARVSELDRLRRGPVRISGPQTKWALERAEEIAAFGMGEVDVEDQIGALGLVLNALVLFNTRYMDAAVNQLRADGFDVRDEDVARLSPFVRHHINMLGRYSFHLPDLPGGLRPLRDPGTADDE